MHIEHWDPARDGELTESNMRRKLQAQGYTVSKYVYPSGTYFPEHDHGVDKIDGVLSGRFRMALQGDSAILEAGDLLAVPKHVLHRAEVVGDEPVVSLDAIRSGQR